MHRWRLLLLVVPLLIAGCSRPQRTTATYNQAVANGVASDPSVIAFQKVYPGAEHFISHYTGEHGAPRWNSHTLIHGRYVLTMQFDVTFDASGTQMTPTSAPAYYLREVSEVRPVEERAEISYDVASQREFGPREWKDLESAAGDLSVLGLKVKRDQPVPNLAAHWRGA